MKILISHPTSNQNNRYSILALKNSNMLHSFITSININHKKFPYNILTQNIKNILIKRNFSNITNKTYTNSLFFEFLKIIFFKLINKNYSNTLYKSNDIFTSKFIIKNHSSIDAVYAYEGAALETFKMAKIFNIKCIYELPTVYWKKKYDFMYNKKSSQNSNNPLDNKQKLINKDKELELADLVLVPSLFVKQTLKKSKIDKKKIFVLPYGFPKVNKHKKIFFEKKNKLKLLYVGRLTEDKGINYLIKAITKLNINHKNKISVFIIGAGPLEDLVKKKLPDAVFKKNLQHKLILNEMQKNDVLIFPSLYEGFGLVISEAMSRGMNVISTFRTALSDIGHKNDSFLISPNSSYQIVEKINFLLKYPNQVKKIGKNAMLTASKYNWAEYQKKLITIITTNL